MRYKFAMIILAAGLSRRMGVLKPLLPVGGVPAVLRCVQIAKMAGIAAIIAVTGHRGTEVEEVMRTGAPDVRVIYNERYHEGMFSSVTTGVRELMGDINGFFLLPADSCAVISATLMTLIDAFVKADGVAVIRPRFGEGSRGHPPLIPVQYIPELCSYTGDDGLKGFLRELPTIEVEVSDSGVRLDMDSPEDYVKLLTHLELPTYPDIMQTMQILAQSNTSPDIAAHGRHVADTALKIARLMIGQGAEIDTSLIESACLLHDIKRKEPCHDTAGSAFLLQIGYPSTAILVGKHMDLPEPVTDVKEAELLYLADKLCRQGKIMKLEDSMRALGEKFSSNPEAFSHAKTRIENAKTILTLLGEKYGITEVDVYDDKTTM
ncbi:MAG: NTP transferase domain-containing protein [Oscillospiraceae bacterium]|nr:NTP transferase domain-containing protein [Oscillospiraceae bacterium]